MSAVDRPAAPAAPGFKRWRMMTVTRTELRQLFQARDFWGPMAGLGAFFFVVVPVFVLAIIGAVGNVAAVQSVSESLDLLPQAAQESLPPEMDASTKVRYTIAVFLLAPVTVVVPLTISTAVGASSIVGERERGTGEFLAHSPADVREIYVGKLLGAIVPGYLTTAIGFGAYSLVVNALVAPDVGYVFFPTPSWWLLILWVLPPFLVLALSLVLRLSARVKSTAAAQQASGLITLPLIIIAYGQSTGALVGESTVLLAVVLGALAWVVAAISLVLNLRAVTRGRLLGVQDET